MIDIQTTIEGDENFSVRLSAEQVPATGSTILIELDHSGTKKTYIVGEVRYVVTADGNFLHPHMTLVDKCNIRGIAEVYKTQQENINEMLAFKFRQSHEN